jgi:hypothetical protein
VSDDERVERLDNRANKAQGQPSPAVTRDVQAPVAERPLALPPVTRGSLTCGCSYVPWR